jgi:rhodanese-related sulfurtransferase
MEVPRMEINELKSRIDDPNIVIIDVRREKNDLKIKNAIIRNPVDVDYWMNQHPKDKTFVFYCS